MVSKIRNYTVAFLTIKNGCGIAPTAIVPENRTLAP